MTDDLLRAPAEVKYAEELDWLESVDDGPKPFSWRLSPEDGAAVRPRARSAPTASTARSRRSGSATAASSSAAS